AILVPRGDRKARIELERPDPDYAVVWQGLIEGRTHPDDIPHVIKLYRRFRRVTFMAEVIAIWDEADRMVDELILAADQLHERASSLNATEQSVRPILHQIPEIDARRTPLEGRFTQGLGRCARRAEVALRLAQPHE